MSYVSKTTRVEAWHHTVPGTHNTEVGKPDWILELYATGTVRDLPDGSIHVTDKHGRLLPVPVDYWLVFDTQTNSIDVMAPDRFAAEYQREE